MSLYLNYGSGKEVYGIDDEALEWRATIIAFAKKAGIDLVAVGCSATASNVQAEEEEAEDEITPESLKGVEKQFDWTKTLKEYKSHHCAGGKLGGDKHNIMKMRRAERASYAFDKKDPLADFTEKLIKLGELGLG